MAPTSLLLIGVDFWGQKVKTEIPDMDIDLDVGAALGATSETSEQILRLYIPDRGKHGQFDPSPWIDEAEGILARIGGGYTILKTEGGYLPEGGELEKEKTTLIYTFLKPEAFARELPRLREFLHSFGRKTKQQEVVAEIDGGGTTRFYRIRKYDKVRGSDGTNER